MFNKHAKGFTLIELLIVIAIVAILAAVVILTLNPAQLLAQSRDSNRISDMATLKSAVSLYLADVSPVNLVGTRSYTSCYESVTQASGTSCGVFVTSTPNGATSSSTSPVANLRLVNGSGWLPVNFTAISAGSPLGNLPVDPTNATNTAVVQWYSYVATTSNGYTFEIDSNMESTKYANGSASGDVESTDGGDQASIYEVGTAPGLTL